VLDARAAAAELVAAAAQGPAAVMFGGERNGLANDELERCQALVRIPSEAAYRALNLAQAVQIICYELHIAARCGLAAATDAPALATADQMLELNTHLEQVMRATGFMHEDNAASLGARVRRLLARARPDQGEVRILRGWLAAIERGLGPPA
jgi:tRNA (cytidine32/uridine32-2'-O)-methyltransferase